jgi:acyl-CoA synthetase (AMP-forming)/AMP-acid ligase II
MASYYIDAGSSDRPNRGGPKRKVTIRNITNEDRTITVITTTETTTLGASNERVTTTEVDTKHMPSLPIVKRDRVTTDDGVTGWKKATTVVVPGGRREITVESPNGEKETKVIESRGEKILPRAETTTTTTTATANGPAEVPPSWSSYSWDSILKRLSHHADVMPHKTAISFLQTSANGAPTVSSSITYQKLHHAVEYLACRLLPPEVGDGANPMKKTTPLVRNTQKTGRPPLARGDRVLLVYPPCSPHFILTFLACIRAGLVAVPVYPPHPDRKESVSAFVGIARGCGARAALTNGEYAQAKRLGSMKSAFAAKINVRGRERRGGGGEDDVVAPTWPEELIWVVTDGEPLQDPPPIGSYPRVEAHPEPHEVAFIQYTSGSTSSPKGVTLTHSNLAHNLHIITSELKASVETRVVSWLPQYHDMGLIGSLVGVIYCGGSGWYMSPIAFLQRPMGWLEAVSEYRGTHLQAPNFAFGLTARKFNPDEYHIRLGGGATANSKGGKKAKALDLSCLKHVVNGAEPVTEKSMEAFRRAFSPFGLPDGVIYPTYGLAEHTVFVCSGGKGAITVMKKELEEKNRAIVVEETESTKRQGILHFVGCGFPSSQNVDVQIVDPVRGVSLPDGTVGEIWIDSPSKAVGYYGKSAKETKADFHAFLEGDEEAPIGSGGYLRSGDLGFLHEGQLYICGRIKDLIIVGGRNHYPQDIEATAEDVASEHVRPGCSAAFSTAVESGDMGVYLEVVIAMELKEPLPKMNECESIVDSIRTEILKEHSLSLSCVVLVKQKTMSKTTSGKIQRSKAHQEFLGKRLQEVYRKEFSTGGVSKSDDFRINENGGDVSSSGHINIAEVKEDCDVADSGDMEMIDIKAGKQSKPNPGESPTTADGVVDRPGVSSASRKDLTPTEIRVLDKREIRNMLLDSISQLANIDKAAIKDGSPLNCLMDSVTLAQLKGLLEGLYAVKPMSDAYLFQDSTTLGKLVEIVKVGAANDDSDERQVVGASAVGGGPGCCGCTVM